MINFDLTVLAKKDLPTVTSWVQESLKTIESTKSQIKDLDIDYSQYLQIIKQLKDKEKYISDIIESLKNKEIEEIEAELLKLQSSFRGLRLESEKNKDAYKDKFLNNAKIKIKDAIVDLVDDLQPQLPNKITTNYISWLHSRVAFYLDKFKGVKVEFYQQNLNSILHEILEMNEILIKRKISQIYQDIENTGFLNKGYSLAIDYNQIMIFDIKSEIERKDSEIELILQKKEENKKREELLQQQNTVSAPAKTSSAISPQKEAAPLSNTYLSKDYLFENKDLILKFAILLKKHCQYKEILVNGTKRVVITDIKDI